MTMTNLTGLFLDNMHDSTVGNAQKALLLCEIEAKELVEDGMDPELASIPGSDVNDELIALHDCIMDYELPYPPVLHHLMAAALNGRGRSAYVTDPWF